MDDHMSREASPPPPVSRRRSSFFERRQSFLVVPLPDPVPVQSSQESKEGERLNKYIEALSNEKVAWKHFYSVKKEEYNECVKNVKSNASNEVTADILYAMLRDEDRQFLEGKPNLRDVWEECNAACVRAKDLLQLSGRLYGGGARYEEYLKTVLTQNHR